MPPFPLPADGPARAPLSVVIITLNAASALPECLDSAAFADEIVVVDSGSTDGTRELAAGRGAKVIEMEWRGFGPQKQAAVQAAAHDWVLCLDADERVSPQLRAGIERQLAAVQGAGTVQQGLPRAYRFARANRFMGRQLRHGEGYPDWSLRLFHRAHARWSADPVHEKVEADGPVGTLDGDLLHESAETLESYLTKQNRYTSLQAARMHERGERAGVARVAFSPLVRFIKFYVFRGGFLDGLPGLVHIAIGCFNSMVKYAKLIALNRDAGGRP